MRYWTICFFIILFIHFEGKTQTLSATQSSDQQSITADTTRESFISSRRFDFSLHANPYHIASVKTVPSAFYYNSLGFFCKKELQIEKALKFPLKLRLGSVAYTDDMEGKGHRNYKEK